MFFFSTNSCVHFGYLQSFFKTEVNHSTSTVSLHGKQLKTIYYLLRGIIGPQVAYSWKPSPKTESFKHQRKDAKMLVSNRQVGLIAIKPTKICC